MYIVTGKQMYAAECAAVERGTTFALLMEKAGRKCAEIINSTYCSDKKKILVIAGKGKNGGDGYVIARILAEKGNNVKMLIPCGRPKDDISVANMNLVDEDIICETDDYIPLIKKNDIIVDAVFGTGFKGKLDDRLSALADEVNKSGKTVVSIDVPSGADCDDATVEGICFEADMTIAISTLKPIHVIKPFCNVCGRVEIADIDIITEDFSKIEPIEFTVTETDIGKIMPERPEVSHKGTFGQALCVCGSRNMPGAAKIASSGALRCGAGLVCLAFPDAAYNAIAPSVMEQVMLPCPSDENGRFDTSSFDMIFDKSKSCSSALIGCGMGQGNNVKRLVQKLIRSLEIPMILDADALNVISNNPAVITEAKSSVIITPHPAEMSRLTGKSVAEIIGSPVTVAKEFADKYNCTVVLKGANTVVASADERRIYVNATGNSGLAKGGSGDLLSGILVSHLAQGVKPFDAAVASVYIHGDCADEVAMFSSQIGMTVSDMINYLPSYFEKFER